MPHKRVAIAGALLIACIGAGTDVWFAVRGMQTPPALFWLANVLILGCVFYWLHYDSARHAYRRSASLNVGIVALGLIFVPWYLFKSRPPGERLRAVLYFFALLLAVFAAAATGAVVASLLLER